MKIDPTKDYRPTIEALTATSDIFGREIAVGSRVRSFDHPFLFGDGTVAGLETENSERISYMEGIVEAIGDTSHGRGHTAYRIRVEKHIHADRFGQPVEIDDMIGEHIVPPVNGLRSLLGGRTFGVVVIPSE
jgi:hypothetical protein